MAGTVLAACQPTLPAGKPWTVDTSAWAGSDQCSEQVCALDAFRTRDFTVQGTVPDALVDGAVVQVHCYVPTPAPQRDPGGRTAHRWYLVTVDSSLLWAPDLVLTSQAQGDLRREATATDDPAATLAGGVRLCDSTVPGR